jgi:hypothetical protein
MRKIHQKAISHFVDLCEEITTPNLSVRRIDNPDLSRNYSKYSGIYVLYSYGLPIAIRQPIAYGKCEINIANYNNLNPAYFEKIDELSGGRIFQKSATTSCHVSNLKSYIRDNATHTRMRVLLPEKFDWYLKNGFSELGRESW